MTMTKKTVAAADKALADVAAKPSSGQPLTTPSLGFFVPYESYALSVSIREATRGYGKATPDSKKGNRRLLYVEVDGWDGLAVCNVTDREQWKPHDRLEGRFVKMRPDYCLEFAYMPGRRAGK